MLQRGRQTVECGQAICRATNSACVETYKGTLRTTWLFPITALENPHHFPNRCSRNTTTLFRARGIMLSEMTPHAGINYLLLFRQGLYTSSRVPKTRRRVWMANVIQYLYRYLFSLLCYQLKVIFHLWEEVCNEEHTGWFMIKRNIKPFRIFLRNYLSKNTHTQPTK